MRPSQGQPGVPWPLQACLSPKDRLEWASQQSCCLHVSMLPVRHWTAAHHDEEYPRQSWTCYRAIFTDACLQEDQCCYFLTQDSRGMLTLHHSTNGWLIHPAAGMGEGH